MTAQPQENSYTPTPQEKMKDLVALCKRRGFIFQASDIYDGLNGFWDYGPLGTTLKNNIRDAWWADMVKTPPVDPDGHVTQIVGLDSSIIQNPKTWQASGHIAGFSDPMVDCRETKKRYRADHLDVYIPKDPEAGDWIVCIANDPEGADKKIKKLRKGRGSRDDYTVTALTDIDVNDYARVIAPDMDKPGTLTAPKDFNLMLKTYIGATATEEDVAYLRPETAQGIFLHFKNVVDSSRVKIPFGIAQIGKAFRNEVTPRNFIFRSREFEQMEMQWFCHPSEAHKWFDFWREKRENWWKSIGISMDRINMYRQKKEDLAHYAKEGAGCIDIEYQFPFCDPEFDEIEGLHDRSTYDLTQHQTLSSKKMTYTDPKTNETYTPNVIETSAGLTRGVLAVIADAFTYDPNRPSKMYLNFMPHIAPVQVAILPLMSKGAQVDLAENIYLNLRHRFAAELDIKQNIGKRYARQDEIGTPFCLTIDSDTLDDKAVTVRHRNTMIQERIAIAELNDYLTNKIYG